MVTRSAKTGATRGTGLSAVDRDALERALEKAKADEPERIERKLERKGWLEVAASAAYVCQRRALGLKPWQSPPMYGDAYPGHDGHAAAAVLLKRLIAAGLSRFEPGPIGALAKIEPPAAA
jgi:hypothetical protein